MDPGRLIEIQAGPQNRPESSGSGYLIGQRLILTARHVVTDPAGDEWPRVVARIGHPDYAVQPRSWVQARLVWSDRAADVALIRLMTEEAAGPGSLVRWGKITGSAEIRYRGMAFPRFADFHGGGVEQLGGVIRPLSGSANLYMLDQDTAPDRDGHADQEWAGSSGASVFCDDAIVGVVTKLDGHHGNRRLHAARTDRLLTDERFRRLVTADCGTAPVLQDVPVADARSRAPFQPAADPYLAKVRAIVPDQLVGREEWLGTLAGFCSGPDTFLWLHAPAWAGKTALLSWFVLHPPENVQVAAFLVTRRFGTQLDSGAYVRAMVRRLAQIAGIPDTAGLDGDAEDWLPWLLEEAARAATEAGGSLLLVVDGLDEDESPPSRRMAELLPRRLPAGARLVVTSRLRPEQELPADHPALGGGTRCRVLELPQWQNAGEHQREATAELSHWLAASPVYREVIGLLAFAGGGLTIDELAELTADGPGGEGTRARVSGAVAEMRRSVAVAQRDLTGEEICVFAHDALLEVARESLRGSRERYVTAIHDLAGRYRSAGWPESTPGYFLAAYPGMLASPHGDKERLVALVTDALRHDRMLALTGTDDSAFAELHETRLSERADLDSHALLAVERDRLLRRNRAIPQELPGVWARLGRERHALTLANCIPNTVTRRNALVNIVKVMPDVEAATRIARSFAEPSLRALALAAAGGRAADMSLISQAIAISQQISDPGFGRDCHTATVLAFARADPAMAENLVCEDEAAVRRYLRDFPAIIEAMCERDPECALRVAGRARDLIAGDAERAEDKREAYSALGAIAVAVSRASPEEALQYLSLVKDSFWNIRVMAALAAHDPVSGPRLLAALEDVVTEAIGYGDSAVLAVAAPAVAGLNPARARELAVRLSGSSPDGTLLAALAASARGSLAPGRIPYVSSITDSEQMARSLTIVAEAVAGTDPGEAGRLAGEAEAFVHASTALDPSVLARACATAAIAVAARDPGKAQETATAIRNPSWRAWALADAARAAAAAGLSDWEAMARDAEREVAALADAGLQGRIFAALAEAASGDPDAVARLTENARRSAGQIAMPARVSVVEKQVEVLAAAARAAGLAWLRGAGGPDLLARARALTEAARQAADRDQADRRPRLLATIAQAIAPFDPAGALELIQPARAAAIARYPVSGPPAPLHPYDPWTRDYMNDIIVAALSEKPNQFARVGAAMPDGTVHTPWEAVALAGVAAELAELAPAPPDGHDWRPAAADLASVAEQVARQVSNADLRAESLAAVAAALAALDGQRAAALAAEVSQLSDAGSLTGGRAAVLLAVAAERSGRGDIHRTATLITQSALAGRMWVDAIPALPLLRAGGSPGGMARVCDVISSYARQSPPSAVR